MTWGEWPEWRVPHIKLSMERRHCAQVCVYFYYLCSSFPQKHCDNIHGSLHIGQLMCLMLVFLPHKVFVFLFSVALQVNLKEQGQLIRQDEFLVAFRKKKCFRHIFLFQELVLFSKTRRTDVGNDTYIYKQSFKVHRPTHTSIDILMQRFCLQQVSASYYPFIPYYATYSSFFLASQLLILNRGPWTFPLLSPLGKLLTSCHIEYIYIYTHKLAYIFEKYDCLNLLKEECIHWKIMESC